MVHFLVCETYSDCAQKQIYKIFARACFEASLKRASSALQFILRVSSLNCYTKKCGGKIFRKKTSMHFEIHI